MSPTPAADERNRYGICGYHLAGAQLIYFASWKKHFSIYPATPVVLATLEKQLAGHEVEKGTIRFPFDEPVPAALIERIARLRVKEVLAETRAKKAAQKKPAPKKSAPRRP